MPPTGRARRGLSDGGRSMNTGETRSAGMREGTGPVAECQPFRVVCATERLVTRLYWAQAAAVQDKICTFCKVPHASRQPSKADTKCHNSTAENSPKRSWISRSDSSRKIQL